MPNHRKLTEDQVREMRRRYANKGKPGPDRKITQEQLAAEYGVSLYTVHQGVIGRKWFRGIE